MIDNVFVELSIILVIAVAVSLILRMLKQPLIIGYIISGILVSPYFFNLLKSVDSIEIFAKMGISVLLFMVGLNLDLKVIKEVGKVALITGLGQILLTFCLGMALTKLFGFSLVASVYISLALSFSSTIIIIKMLSDEGETNTVYGKISIGILIVKDLIAIIILIAVSSLQNGTDLSSFATEKIFTGVAAVGVLILTSRIVLPELTKLISKSQELLLLFSIAWAFALASLFQTLGFSIEIGALLAGITLSASPYRYEIGAKMKPLRDFFILLFFILIGSQLSFGNAGSYVWPIIIFSLLVFIVNPLIVMLLMGSLRYTKRNSFLTGLTASQISEFSFILISLGVTIGHISGEILSMMTIIGLTTMILSAYTIRHGKFLYERLSDKLNILERKGRKIDESKYHQDIDYEAILFGYNRIGYNLKSAFDKIKKNLLIVDNNPEVIKKLSKNGIDCRYGDAEDIELLDELPLKEAKMIISTIPDLHTNLLLIKSVKRVNKEIIFLAVSHQIDEALALYEAGATYVITPHFFGGLHTANLLEKHGFKKTSYENDAVMHASELIRRKREGQKDVLHERD